jgi:hypothetical protein
VVFCLQGFFMGGGFWVATKQLVGCVAFWGWTVSLYLGRQSRKYNPPQPAGNRQQTQKTKQAVLPNLGEDEE